MFTLIALLLTSPIREIKPDMDRCAGLEAGDWHRCQPRVINLGSWDPRPSPKDWQYSIPLSDPKEWGEYPTEKRD